MKIQNKDNVSVIIVNYNNAEFLQKSINSILNQNYKINEIIVVDNKSTDHSLKILKRYKKKIFIIKNLKRTKYGSFNQINSYYEGFLRSNGEYLFFLDSDDYFKKDKIKLIMSEFKKKNMDLIFDLPILKFKSHVEKKTFRQKKFLLSSWPRFSPQSCICLKRKLAEDIFENVRIMKYESVWFDFRIAIYYFLKKKNIYILNKYLTYYRQLDISASKNYKFLSKNWWYRRNQAHDLVSYLSKKLKLKDKLTFDKVITKFTHFFINV